MAWSKSFYAVDLCLDLSQIDTPSAHEMNSVGQRFGLTGNDFFSFLTNDVEEQEAMRLARQQEEEKAMFSVSFTLLFVLKNSEAKCLADLNVPVTSSCLIHVLMFLCFFFPTGQKGQERETSF